MSNKLPKIYELHFSFNPFVELAFAFHLDRKYNKDEKLVKQFADCFNHKPLAKTWKPVGVHREDSSKGDFAAVEATRFAVSAKAKKVLEKEYSEILEFLPVEVVGKLVETDDYDVAVKPIRSKETFFLLNPITDVEVGKKSKFEKYPAGRQYYSCEFDKEQIENTPIFRPKHAMTIFVTEHFKQFVQKKKLRGVAFEKQRLVQWVALPEGSKKTAVTNKQQKTAKPKVAKPKATSTRKKSSGKASDDATELKLLPQPKTCSHLVEKKHQRMSKKLWNAMLDSWKWHCDVAVARGDEAGRPKVSKPISKSQLESLRKKVGQKLPVEFEHVLVNFSRKVDFWWGLDEAARICAEEADGLISGIAVPDEFSESMMGGCVLWDIKCLPEFAETARNHASSDWLAFQDGLRDRLPFLAAGNGDLIAFDMRKGHKDCPIVYLNHDNDPDYNERRIGDNFVDFLANWSSVGCVGPEIWGFDVFCNKRKISGAGRNAKRWRKFMETGR